MSPAERSATGAYAGISYNHSSRLPSLANGFVGGVGVGVGVPEGVGVAVGVGVGVAFGVGVTVGVGVGVGEVKVLPLNEPGFVPFTGDPATDDVAFELKTIHFPSLLITGRVFTISTRTLKYTGVVMLVS